MEVRLRWLEEGEGGEPPGKERQARIAGSDSGEKRAAMNDTSEGQSPQNSEIGDKSAGDGEGKGAPSMVHLPVWFKRFDELQRR